LRIIQIKHKYVLYAPPKNTITTNGVKMKDVKS